MATLFPINTKPRKQTKGRQAFNDLFSFQTNRTTLPQPAKLNQNIFNRQMSSLSNPTPSASVPQQTAPKVSTQPKASTMTAPAVNNQPSGGVPAGFTKISGAEFPTAEAQRKAFSDIRAVGEVGKPGSYLIGKRQTTPTPEPTTGVAPVEPTPTPTSTEVEKPKVPSFFEQQASLRQEAQKQFQPSARETELQKQIDALLNIGQAGIAREEDRPIPKPFVTGRQAAIERQTGVRTTPLIQELGREQTARLNQAQLAAQQQQAPMVFGNQLIDPNTGEVILEQPEKAESFTLSPGETRFDAQGNILASVVKPEEDPLDELLSPNELALFNAPAGSTMRDVIGNVPKEQLTGVQKFNQEIALGKQFESLVGDARKASTAVGNINSSLDLANKAMEESKSINAASQGVLVAFQKLLDPDSVVRESEYARSGNGQSLWDRMKGTWQTLNRGGADVTMEELANFVETANIFLKGYENTMLKHAKRMKIIADRQGLDLPSILTQDVINLINQSDQAQNQKSQQQQQQEFETLKQEFPDLSDQDILNLIQGFNQVGGDTNTALNRPQRNNNPGNVKRGGIADQFALKDQQGNPLTDEQGHLIFPNAQAGFQGLSADVGAKISGNSRVIPFANPTIQQLGSVYAEDPGWANSVASMLGVAPTTKTQSINFNNLVKAIAQQEGFYA